MMLNELKKSALDKIEKIKDSKSLENLRIKYLGRKGELTKILRGLKDLTLDERRKTGPLAQKIKKELEELIQKKRNEIIHSQSSIVHRPLDVTKPGYKINLGHLHPLSKMEEEIRQIFLSLNFSVVEGPEIETEYYNFDALNIPKNHPARDAWDTFWIKSEIQNSKFLLRTHTSPMQIHYMESHEPPFQIIVPGRVFRYEATDFSHEINFHQIEGFMVGKDVSLANFKFIIETLFKKLFGENIEFRFRPGYFPFTEPSLEVDIKFKGQWLEIMGAGMIHRKVFDVVRYNPDEWQGFAFGLSPERLAMIKYNIPDIRLFYSGDLRFIEQF